MHLRVLQCAHSPCSLCSPRLCLPVWLLAETVGVGEREGRVQSALVRGRHMGLAHGVGRSGDLLAQQPKAAGSSLLHSLTHALVLHAVKLAGLTEAKQVLLLPVATGMSIVLTLTAIKHNHPSWVKHQQQATAYAQALAQAAAGGMVESVPSSSSDSSSISSSSTPAAAASSSSSSNAAISAAAAFTFPLLPAPPAAVAPLFVLWSRIDQKTCLKSISAAGCVALVVELVQVGDQLQTDLVAMERAMTTLGPASIVAVVSTTSCFAPRAPDKSVHHGSARSLAFHRAQCNCSVHMFSLILPSFAVILHPSCVCLQSRRNLEAVRSLRHRSRGEQRVRSAVREHVRAAEQRRSARRTHRCAHPVHGQELPCARRRSGRRRVPTTLTAGQCEREIFGSSSSNSSDSRFDERDESRETSKDASRSEGEAKFETGAEEQGRRRCRRGGQQ